MSQELSKLDVTEYYIKYKTGRIVPIYGKNSHIELEKQLQQMIKNGQSHLIEYEIITRSAIEIEPSNEEFIPIYKRKNKK